MPDIIAEVKKDQSFFRFRAEKTPPRSVFFADRAGSRPFSGRLGPPVNPFRPRPIFQP
jgi:hypothetical protein